MPNGDHAEHLRRQKSATAFGELTTISKPLSLFDGFLVRRSVVIVGAEPFSGKTLFLLAMALSLDSGIPLLEKWKPSQNARTLFIGQDAPTWDYQNQALKLMRGYGISEGVAKLLSSDLVLNEGIKLTDPSFWSPHANITSWLDEYYYAFPFDVLMFDTMPDFHDMKESDPDEMKRLGQIIKGIRARYGCNVMLSHHLAKPTEAGRSPLYRLRGGSSISGWLDYYIELTRNAGGGVNLAMHKGRGSEYDFKPLSFKILTTEDSVKLLLQDRRSLIHTTPDTPHAS